MEKKTVCFFFFQTKISAQVNAGFVIMQLKSHQIKPTFFPLSYRTSTQYPVEEAAGFLISNF